MLDLSRALALAVVLGTVATVPAQQFSELRATGLPDLNPSIGGASEFLDANGDGFLDVVLTGYRVDPILLLNDGTGLFVDGTAGRLNAPFGQFSYSEFVPIDFDLDGDMDLYESRSSLSATGLEQDRLHQNDGTGVFTDVTASMVPPETADMVDPLFADVTGDGFPDIVGRIDVFVGSEELVLLTSTNGAGWVNSTVNLPSTMFVDSFTLIDADTDGDLDIAVSGNGHRLLLNDGSGNFTNGPTIEPNTLLRGHLAADLDGDGDTDLLVSKLFGSPITLMINNGSGVFVDETATRLPSDAVFPNKLDDVDGDGDVDVLISSFDANYWAINDGSGFFLARSQDLPTRFTAVGDVDNDGDLDLFSQEFVSFPRLFLNDGTSTYRDLGLPTTSTPGLGRVLRTDTAIADFNLDGHLDVAFTTLVDDSPFGNLLLGDGYGSFVSPTPTPGLFPQWFTVATADVDGDGDPDLAMAGANGGVSLLENDGAANFTDVSAGRVPTTGESAISIAFSDVDGDGDQDFIRMGFNSISELYLNDGAGTFSLSPNSPFSPTTRVRNARFGDIDRDGDEDIVVVGDFRLTEIYLNDGLGNFTNITATAISQPTVPIYDVAIGDVDGDGFADLAFALWNASTQLFLNNGNSTFRNATLGRLPIDSNLDAWIEMFDADDDGDLDFLLGDANVNGTLTRLLVNDGAGFFSVGQEFTNNGRPGVLDFDSDGDVDLLLDNTSLPNLRRHLYYSKPLRVGEVTELTLTFRGRPGNVGVTGLVFFSGQPASLPTVFGRLGIDFAGAIQGPLINVGANQDEASAPIPVPNLPSLAGVEIYSQALTLESVGSRLVLTNTSRDVLFL